MPLHPNNTTVVPPQAPTAARAAQRMPWELANLSGIGGSLAEDPDLIDLELAAVAELEFFFASRAPASQWSIAPAPHPATLVEITTHQPLARPSEQEPLSPLQLQRAGVQEDPVVVLTTGQAGLRHIAGTPLTSPPAVVPAQRMPANDFSHADDLLWSPSGSHPALNHVTPEFDSTHQVMRIPPPHGTLLPPGMPGVRMSGTLRSLPQTPPAPDAEAFQADIAMPPRTPAFSWTLDLAGTAHSQRTSTPTPPLPQSAPPTLERLPAVAPPMLRARAQDDHMYLQAMVNERVHVALLQGGLGELQDSAVPGLDAAPHRTYAFDAYAACQLRTRQLPATETAEKDTGSDDEAAQLVGSPDPFAM